VCYEGLREGGRHGGGGLRGRGGGDHYGRDGVRDIEARAQTSRVRERDETPLDRATLQGLGPKKVARLAAVGVRTVHELARVDVTDQALVVAATSNRRFDRAVATLSKWRKEAANFLERRKDLPPGRDPEPKKRHRASRAAAAAAAAARLAAATAAHAAAVPAAPLESASSSVHFDSTAPTSSSSCSTDGNESRTEAPSVEMGAVLPPVVDCADDNANMDDDAIAVARPTADRPPAPVAIVSAT